MDVLSKTKIILCKELLDAGIAKTHIAERLEVDRDTVRVWNKGINESGLTSFLDRYKFAKKGPRLKRQVNPLIKTWIWEIREREADCCGQKILYFLKKEHKTSLSVPKIYEILAEKYQIKSKWKKNQVEELNQMVLNYLERYHYHRPHISLGMRPPLERS